MADSRENSGIVSSKREVSGWSEEEFVTGKPEALLDAFATPRILMTWLHGNESLGPKVAHRIQEEDPALFDHLNYICGNPVAAGAVPSVRYTETDLNRSFNLAKTDGYEARRAIELLGHISLGQYDYVLDVHTSATNVGAFMLINERNLKTEEIIAASKIDKIVVMPDSIAKSALIGHVKNSLSIEYNKELADEQGIGDVVDIIKQLVAPCDTPLIERELFYVTRAIPKTEDPGIDAENFELCKDGYYPVLFGNNTYRKDKTKNYLGFAATHKEVVSL